MAKRRHEETQSSSSKATMAIMAVAGVAVAALVGLAWYSATLDASQRLVWLEDFAAVNVDGTDLTRLTPGDLNG